MMSIHRVESHPQFLSTDRHVMQGYVDLARYPVWNPRRRTLAGKARVIGGEPYKIVVAGNGWHPVGHQAKPAPDGLWELTLNSDQNQEMGWSLTFER